jgi:hypothetical protein
METRLRSTQQTINSNFEKDGSSKPGIFAPAFALEVESSGGASKQTKILLVLTMCFLIVVGLLFPMYLAYRHRRCVPPQLNYEHMHTSNMTKLIN